MTILNRTGLFIIGFSIAFSANAFDIAKEFSAEAVQRMAGQPSTNVKMFVSKKAVRTESVVNGNTLVEIVYPKEKKRVLLNKNRKSYVEQQAKNNMSTENKNNSNSPCRSIFASTCKNMGNEKINGRNAVKWEVTAQRNGQKLKSLHWLDKKYNMPLREQFPDGTVSTMTLAGKEKINGRNTEKWTFQTVRPDGQTMDSQQWYDPILKMVIREALSGGYVRELRNIKVAKQNKKLFEIPSDYTKEGVPNPRAAR